MASGINDTFRQVGVAVGIATWGAVFLGRGADRVAELTAGTPAAEGERPRLLVEAASSGSLETALGSVPVQARDAVELAAREGFLTGVNDILVLGALLAAAGAVVALWLVRERDIERDAVESDELESQGSTPRPVGDPAAAYDG